jgi:DNA-nicking Smr family endonuclease
MVRSLGVLDRLLLRLLGGASRGGTAAPVLDLHGYGVQDALAATERFLAEAVASGVREVRIVYGKGRGSPGGRGVLREVVPRWLATGGKRWVVSATPETDSHGEDGAIRVVLFTSPRDDVLSD